jgi:hypothetical protein
MSSFTINNPMIVKNGMQVIGTCNFSNPINFGNEIIIGGSGTISYNPTGLIFNSNIIPSTGSQFSIGTNANKWKNLYSDNASITSLTGTNSSLTNIINSSFTGTNLYASNVTITGGSSITTNNLILNNQSIHLGTNSGNSNQSVNGIAIGNGSGRFSQQDVAIAIGVDAGRLNQTAGAIAIGNGSGDQYQGVYGISIGRFAGSNNQGVNSIAIGTQSGEQNQGAYSVALGYYAGNTSQPSNSIVLNATGIALNPSTAGLFVNPIRNVQNSQLLEYNTSLKEITYSNSATLSNLTVSNLTGTNANLTNTNTDDLRLNNTQIHLGTYSGLNSQGSNTVAIGYFSGNTDQGTGSVALGYGSGVLYQSQGAIAIGDSSGGTNQGEYSVAIGYNAGYAVQGAYGLALGCNAGRSNAAANSIILNATGTELNPSTAGFFVNPIRNVQNSQLLEYNTALNEITYSNSATLSNLYVNDLVSNSPPVNTFIELQSTITNLNVTGTKLAGTISFTFSGTATANTPYFTIYINNPTGVSGNNNPVAVISPANSDAGTFIQSSYYLTCTNLFLSMICGATIPPTTTRNCKFNYMIMGFNT